jgi:hypothetical protein
MGTATARFRGRVEESQINALMATSAARVVAIAIAACSEETGEDCWVEVVGDVLRLLSRVYLSMQSHGSIFTPYLCNN